MVKPFVTKSKKHIKVDEETLEKLKTGRKAMDDKIAQELIRIAKALTAAPLDDLKKAVGEAKSFMDVGKELKKARIKYDFSTSPMAIYMVKLGGTKYAIVNKKYADDADFVIGDIAVGKLGSMQRQAKANVPDRLSSELRNIARRLAGSDWQNHPKMDEALDVADAAKSKLVKWLNDNTRLYTWKVVGPMKSSSLSAGIGASLRFSVKEDRQRGGGFWEIEVYANVDGDVIVEYKMPMDRRSFKTYSTLDWGDLRDPKKVFKGGNLPH